jgi:hypothetical protein
MAEWKSGTLHIFPVILQKYNNVSLIGHLNLHDTFYGRSYSGHAAKTLFYVDVVLYVVAWPLRERVVAGLARRIAYKDAGCPHLDSSSFFVLVS